MDSFFLISGIATGLYSLFSIADYFSLQGITALRKKEAENLIARGVIKRIVDVRTKSEWNAGHHRDAIHIPLASLSIDNAKLRRIDKSDGILLCCQAGKRALEGLKLLHSYGFKNVYYLISDRFS